MGRKSASSSDELRPTGRSQPAQPQEGQPPTAQPPEARIPRTGTRKWDRLLPGPQSGKVRFRTRDQTVRVAFLLDESVDGIALQLQNGTELTVGQIVEVSWSGMARGAVVRSVVQHGIFYRVGLQWRPKTED